MARSTRKRRRRNAPPAAARANPSRRRTRRTRRNAPAVARANPSRRRRYRRNPPASLSNIVPFTMDAAVHAGTVLGGKVLARKARQLLGQKPGTLLGAIAEAGVGIAAGLAASRMVSPTVGSRIAAGGLLAPMETLLSQLAIPGVSDALGDDGFLLSGGVELVSAYPDDYAGVSGYAEGPAQLSGYASGGANVDAPHLVAM